MCNLNRKRTHIVLVFAILLFVPIPINFIENCAGRALLHHFRMQVEYVRYFSISCFAIYNSEVVLMRTNLFIGVYMFYVWVYVYNDAGERC